MTLLLIFSKEKTPGSERLSCKSYDPGAIYGAWFEGRLSY